jgi:hypothetical protein
MDLDVTRGVHIDQTIGEARAVGIDEGFCFVLGAILWKP